MTSTTSRVTTSPRVTAPGTFYRMVVDSAHDLHTIAGPDGTYRFVSEASTRLFGWDPAEVVGLPRTALVHPDDAPVMENAHRQALFGPSDTVTAVWRFLCADGSYRWIEAASRVIVTNDEPMVISTIRDISDRRHTELDLHRLATTDPLTGVANRAIFMDRLGHALSRLDRRDGLVAIYFVDLDEFKRINDTVGHLVGDAVLLQAADRLRALLRPQDTVARLGGDEFALVIEDLGSPREILALGERIATVGRSPFASGEKMVRCTISVGISATTDYRHGAETLLNEADMALYRAKAKGRDRIDLFDDELRHQAIGRLGVERMVRDAIDDDRLRLVYQPLVDLQTGTTVAAEALVRVWDTETSQLVDAESFIATAAQGRLVQALDDWVLDEVIQQAARWRDSFAGRAFIGIGVNLTSFHLDDPAFADRIVERLLASGAPAETLHIEVTERVLLESSSATAGLATLRDHGAKVALDDFGTGYSSLSHLRMFPLDLVKIDHSLIQALGRGGPERAVVKAIIDLCHALGLKVVAEGIETRFQLDQLAALRCDFGQGFHLGHPGPTVAIEDRVLNRSSTG